MIKYINAQYKKPLSIAGLVVIASICLLGLIYGSWQSQQRAGKYPVQIALVPRSAKVYNHTTKQPLPSHGTAYLAPGEYLLQVSRQGYDDYRQTVTVTKDGPNTFYAGLAPRSQAAQTEARHNRRLYSQLEQKSAQAAQQFNHTYSKKYPIVTKLPIKDPYYTVGYRFSNQYGIVVTISGTSPRYRAAAIAAIYRAGFDPSDYVLEFKNFTNPLTHHKEQP